MLKTIILLGAAAQALALPTLASSNSTYSSTTTPYVVPELEPASTAAIPTSAPTTVNVLSPALLAKAQDVVENFLDNLNEDQVVEYINHLTEGAHPVEKRGLGAAIAGLAKFFAEMKTGGASRQGTH